MRLIACLSALLLCVSCVSAETPAVDKLRSKLAETMPDFKPDELRESEAPGLYEVRKGQTFGYITSDGKYLIQGDLINLDTGTQITEERRKTDRLKVLATLGPDNVIEFAPKNPTSTVTVFTDIDCGYCRKLHRELKDFHAQGIAVRYVFYPRSGPDTPSFAKAQEVWCAADRKDAMTKAKSGIPLDGNTVCPGSSSVARQYQTGDRLGINATPMIVLPDGDLVRGYVPASALAVRLAQGDWAGVN